MSEDIIGYEHKEWTDSIQRFKNISDFVLDILIKLIYQIFIEGILLGLKVKVFFKSFEKLWHTQIQTTRKKVTLILPLYQVLLKKVQQEKVTQIKTKCMRHL